MSERFVYHKGGKIARKDLSSGSLFFDGNAFDTFSMPTANGNYVLRINDGKPEYVSEAAAPQLDTDVYPTNFQNDNTAVLTREGMVPVMQSTEKWTTLQLTSDPKSIITYSDGKWQTSPLTMNSLGINVDGSFGYVLSNSASGVTTKKVDRSYIFDTIGVSQENKSGLMAYSNRAYVNIDFPTATQGLFGIKKDANTLSTELININTFVNNIDNTQNGIVGIVNGEANYISGDDMNNSIGNPLGIVRNQNNDSLSLKRVVSPSTYTRLTTAVTVENTDIPLNELFNNFYMNTEYGNALINFTLILHVTDTAAFDDLNTDAFMTITDGKYTYDSFYLRNPMSNTITVKFSYIVNCAYDVFLRCNNIPTNNVTIIGNIGTLHALYF